MYTDWEKTVGAAACPELVEWGRRIGRKERFLATKERIERKGFHNEMKHTTNVGEEFSTDVYHALAWPSHGSGAFLFVMFFLGRSVSDQSCETARVNIKESIVSDRKSNEVRELVQIFLASGERHSDEETLNGSAFIKEVIRMGDVCRGIAGDEPSVRITFPSEEEGLVAFKLILKTSDGWGHCFGFEFPRELFLEEVLPDAFFTMVGSDFDEFCKDCACHYDG